VGGRVVVVLKVNIVIDFGYSLALAKPNNKVHVKMKGSLNWLKGGLLWQNVMVYCLMI
jgi:hypothetical protein